MGRPKKFWGAAPVEAKQPGAVQPDSGVAAKEQPAHKEAEKTEVVRPGIEKQASDLKNHPKFAKFKNEESK